jgi:hypothetical protein
MSDFLLTPDAESARPARQLRLVATGLADTAEVPRSHRARPAPPPCYVPCEACGGMVLVGVTATGVRLAVETHVKTYVVQLVQGERLPRFSESRAYPVHTCTPERS